MNMKLSKIKVARSDNTPAMWTERRTSELNFWAQSMCGEILPSPSWQKHLKQMLVRYPAIELNCEFTFHINVV